MTTRFAWRTLTVTTLVMLAFSVWRPTSLAQIATSASPSHVVIPLRDMVSMPPTGVQQDDVRESAYHASVFTMGCAPIVHIGSNPGPAQPHAVVSGLI